MEHRIMVGLVVGGVLGLTLASVLVHEARDLSQRSFTYPVQWNVASGVSSQQTGQLQEGQREAATFSLTGPNVTSVRLWLTWRDDVGEPDRFQVRVEPPAGFAVRNASSDNGTITMTYTVASVPALDAVQAPSQEAALAQLARQHTQTNGAGEWVVQVTLDHAPGQRPVPQAPELETAPDGANTFTLSFTTEAYRAQVGQPTGP